MNLQHDLFSVPMKILDRLWSILTVLVHPYTMQVTFHDSLKVIISRPGVSGAVLQTSLLLIDQVSEPSLQIFNKPLFLSC